MLLLEWKWGKQSCFSISERFRLAWSLTIANKVVSISYNACRHNNDIWRSCDIFKLFLEQRQPQALAHTHAHTHTSECAKNKFVYFMNIGLAKEAKLNNYVSRTCKISMNHAMRSGSLAKIVFQIVFFSRFMLLLFSW